jgi:long-chain-fatty-acid--CoA ligase ACSBG
MVVTLKTDMDPQTGLPTTTLSPIVLMTLAKVGSVSKSSTEAKDDKIIRDVIQSAVSKYNQTATSNAQRIQKFVVLGEEFTITGGEMTATLKLKRSVVLEKYQDIINSMYEGGDN